MMLGARTGAWAKSGYTARDYVQDGLVAMWDGIENAGWGVHDPNATVWQDLSGNGNDLSVTQFSGISWLDTAIQNTSGQYCVAESLQPLPDTHQIEVVFACFEGGADASILKTVVNSGNADLCVAIKGDAGSYGILNSGGNTGNGWRGLYGATQAEAAGNWRRQGIMSLSVSDSPRTIVFQGSPKTPDADTWSKGSTSLISICGSGTQYQWGGFNGRVYNVRFYNRSLSASEISSNYAIDKARFELP